MIKTIIYKNRKCPGLIFLVKNRTKFKYCILCGGKIEKIKNRQK